MTTLILGGARSGKSLHAQRLAESLSPNRLFVATAEAHDEEMEARIARHIADRGSSWQTIECPLNITACLRENSSADQVILIDCLTLWLSNLMHAECDLDVTINEFTETVTQLDNPLVLVSNEVGLGVVPATRLGRDFRDAQGRLNQTLAAACDHVEFIAAGLPLTLKR
ncbi:MAG: bifunctional adenosylcobinamide kinase/adenosylcobinamide-phosphate guanylyltransferase [Pseudomonadota bacterium]